MNKAIDAIAIRSVSNDGRTTGKAMIQVRDDEQAKAILEALNGIIGLDVSPCYREFDAFGRMVWMQKGSY